MPSRYKPHLEFANFICTFGSEVLFDYLDEIVLPAFLDDTLERRYSETSYFLNGCSVVLLEDGAVPVIGICGRFVKDTVLRRTQVWQPGVGLVPDEQSMNTAPTALFLLVLNNHKLVYLHETIHSPSLLSFERTVQRFLREKHKQYVRGLHEEYLQRGERATFFSLYEQHPPPSLDVIALSSEGDLEAFVNRFGQLNTVKVDLVNTNDELDNDPFFYDRLRRRKDDIDSVKTTIQHYNPKGLDRQNALEQLMPVSTQGNALVKLSGKDINGDDLSGSQDDFKLRVPQANLPVDDVDRIRRLFEVFREHVRAGTIRLQHIAESAVSKIMALRQDLNR
ncbi:MAG: hypothetical protein M1133_02415 [Armatimonadetes bacterium]|nr:hypothetical protein [Armatimonadota bacterium]